MDELFDEMADDLLGELFFKITDPGYLMWPEAHEIVLRHLKNAHDMAIPYAG